MLVPAAAAVAGKLVQAALLATTAARFATTGIYQLTASGTWEDLAWGVSRSEATSPNRSG
jgi:hypothetical protein